MSTIAEVAGSMQATQTSEASNSSAASKAKNSKVSGRTIGEPKLSEEGAK